MVGAALAAAVGILTDAIIIIVDATLLLASCRLDSMTATTTTMPTTTAMIAIGCGVFIRDTDGGGGASTFAATRTIDALEA